MDRLLESLACDPAVLLALDGRKNSPHLREAP